MQWSIGPVGGRAPGAHWAHDHEGFAEQGFAQCATPGLPFRPRMLRTPNQIVGLSGARVRAYFGVSWSSAWETCVQVGVTRCIALMHA